MSVPDRGLLVVTDLDGTLLDDSYDLANAANAMDKFTGKRSDVIPASSKTLQELHQLNEHRSQPSALIFENGAGVAYPTAQAGTPLPYRVEGQGPDYSELCNLLDHLRASLNLPFDGFHDFTEAQVAEQTGLSLSAAGLAKQRLFSEPLHWFGSSAQQQTLQDHLQEQELQLISGGRFLHVMPLATKGVAAAQIAAKLDADQSHSRLRIACGDSDNDVPLLRWADAFVLFPKRNGEYLQLDGEHFVLAAKAGTKHWIQCVETLIQSLDNPDLL